MSHNDRPTCQNPTCFKKFKGDRGLKIHLGLKLQCGKWYRKVFASGNRSRSSSLDSAPSSIASGQSTSSARSGVFPWPTFRRSRGRSPSCAPVPSQPPEPPDTPPGSDDDNGNARIQPANLFDEVFLNTDSDAESEASRRTTFRVVEFAGAAKAYDNLKGFSILEEIENNHASLEEEYGIYYPFQSLDDFTVAAWLCNSGVSMANIDKFLKLPFVSHVFTIFRTLNSNSNLSG